jgi:hypothetical protein
MNDQYYGGEMDDDPDARELDLAKYIGERVDRYDKLDVVVSCEKSVSCGASQSFLQVHDQREVGPAGCPQTPDRNTQDILLREGATAAYPAQSSALDIHGACWPFRT